MSHSFNLYRWILRVTYPFVIVNHPHHPTQPWSLKRSNHVSISLWSTWFDAFFFFLSLERFSSLHTMQIPTPNTYSNSNSPNYIPQDWDWTAVAIPIFTIHPCPCSHVLISLWILIHRQTKRKRKPRGILLVSTLKLWTVYKIPSRNQKTNCWKQKKKAGYCLGEGNNGQLSA